MRRQTFEVCANLEGLCHRFEKGRQATKSQIVEGLEPDRSPVQAYED
jgi:hypothetical protein